MYECQRPKRAFFISTTFSLEVAIGKYVMCQRPKRAFFISTLNTLKMKIILEMCVNALNGLSLFLRKSIKNLADADIVCQRPKRAFFISTVDTLQLFQLKLSVSTP